MHEIGLQAGIIFSATGFRWKLFESTESMYSSIFIPENISKEHLWMAACKYPLKFLIS